MPTTASEEHALRRAVAGDRPALERVLAMHYSRLRQLVEKRLSREARLSVEADDVVQEAFADAARHIGQFEQRGHATFFAWLSHIAENKLRDMIRRQRAAKRGAGRRGMQLERSGVIDLLQQVAVSSRTPSRSAVRREAVAAVQVALRALPPDYREALRLRYIDGLPLAQAAARMRRTEGAVQMLCHRALRQMREILRTNVLPSGKN